MKNLSVFTIKKTGLIVILGIALLLSLTASGYCAEGSGFVAQAQSAVAVKNTKQLQSQLQEWIVKAEACDAQNPSEQCQELLQAIEVLKTAINGN